MREVETKLQPAAMPANTKLQLPAKPANPPGSTPEKHKNLRVYTALMKSAVAISAFFGAKFRTMATEKLGNFLEKKSPKLRNHEFEKYK